MLFQFTKRKLTESEPTVSLDVGLDNAPQPVVNTRKITYPFVDLIRFISTIGIVWIHSEFLLPKDVSAFYHKVPHIEVYFITRQLFKFATICYFLLAGFLLADKIGNNQRFNYFMRRFNTIVKPYLLAVVLFIGVSILLKPYSQKLNITYLYLVCKYVVQYTAFWYIPNFLVCLLVIVLFAKYLKSIYFGAALFLITMGYTYFNVYSQHHNGSHTTALFGFVFYMWLGMYIKTSGLINAIRKFNPVILGGVLLFIFAMSNWEIWQLFMHSNTHDCLNTLRIFNQLYSVAMFIFLVRCCGNKPNFGIFRPRQETYGIYLYHYFFIFFFIPLAEAWICKQYNLTMVTYNVYEIIAVNFLNFVICYFATTLVVKFLIRFKLAWLPYE